VSPSFVSPFFGLKIKAEQLAMNTKTASKEPASSVYVPPLQLTEGQTPPIAANGGLSYMSVDRDGDAGTVTATEEAIQQIHILRIREVQR
jgi:hypothetical protein